MTRSGRPLFRDEASFRALYALRLPSYQQADHRVDSSGEPSQVVAEILRLGIISTGQNEAHLVVDKPQPKRPSAAPGGHSECICRRSTQTATKSVSHYRYATGRSLT